MKRNAFPRGPSNGKRKYIQKTHEKSENNRKTKEGNNHSQSQNGMTVHGGNSVYNVTIEWVYENKSYKKIK